MGVITRSPEYKELNVAVEPGAHMITAGLEEQIRTLKQQRLLAILSTIGAVLAFFILNHSKIMNIVKPPPSIKLEVKNPYVRRIGKLHIESTGMNTGESNIDTSVMAALDWIPMKAESYRLILSINIEASSNG